MTRHFILFIIFLPFIKCYLVDVTNNLTFPNSIPSGTGESDLSWIDYNNDGRLDFLLSGRTFYTPGVNTPIISEFYSQVSDGIFEEINTLQTFPNGILPGVRDGISVWEDFNGDGRQDFIYIGIDNGFDNSSDNCLFRLYLQNENGSFIDFSSNSTTFPDGTPLGRCHGTASVVDYDSNGNIDFSLSGRTSGVLDDSITEFNLYSQQSNGVFIDVSNNISVFPGGSPPGTRSPTISWFDYDNDGKMDFVFTGSNHIQNFFILYRQDSNGAFIDVTSSAFDVLPPTLWYASTEWYDYNNDGRVDLLVTGQGNGPTQYFNLYSQYSDGQFQDVTSSAFQNPPSHVAFGKAIWVDLNHDGNIDIFASGNVDSIATPSLNIYIQNDTSGLFEDHTSSIFFTNPPDPSNFNDIEAGDYNNDGTKDIIITGYRQGSLSTYFNIYRSCYDYQIYDENEGGCSTCPFGYTSSDNHTICEEIPCPFTCTPNGKCYATLQNQVCSCFSGYDGNSCGAKISQANCPDSGRFTATPLQLDYLPFLDPNDTAPSLVSGQLELTILSPLVLNRLNTTIYFEGSTDDSCSFPLGPYWNKILDSSECLDTWELSIPWEHATSNCGFQKEIIGSEEIYTSTIVIAQDEDLDVSGISFIRRVENTFQIEVSFPSTISVSSGGVNISAPPALSMGGAITSSTFDTSSVKANVELVIVSQWPYKLNTNATVIQTPSLKTIESILQTSEYCTSVEDSTCIQRFTVIIDPNTECFLDGDYIFNFTSECRATPDICSFTETQYATITVSLASTDLCSEISFDVGASASIESFDDLLRTIPTTQYQLGDTAYIRALASVDNDALDLSNTTIKTASIDILSTSETFQLIVNGQVQTDPPLLATTNIQLTPSGLPNAADFQVDMLFQPGPVVFSVELELQFVGNRKRVFMEERTLKTSAEASIRVSIVEQEEIEEETEIDNEEINSGVLSLYHHSLMWW